MASPAVWLGAGIAAVVAALVAGYYSRWWVLTRRSGGDVGARQNLRLRCPKCRASFDYAWYPGASLRAVRLGRRRYMACPKCGKRSTFTLRRSDIRGPK